MVFYTGMPSSLFISCIFTCDDLLILFVHSAVQIHEKCIFIISILDLLDTQCRPSGKRNYFLGTWRPDYVIKFIFPICVCPVVIYYSLFFPFDLLFSMLIDAKNWTDNYSVNEQIKHTFREYLISLVCMC